MNARSPDNRADGSITLPRWIDGFERSLSQGDATMFRTLFTDDASFQMSPFEAPLCGADIRDAIDEFRARLGEGEWTVEVWADRGDTAILHWSASGASGVAPAMLGDGVLILRFSPGGRCKQARLWHHWHPPGAPLSAGFVENPAPGQVAKDRATK